MDRNAPPPLPASPPGLALATRWKTSPVPAPTPVGGPAGERVPHHTDWLEVARRDKMTVGGGDKVSTTEDGGDEVAPFRGGNEEAASARCSALREGDVGRGWTVRRRR